METPLLDGRGEADDAHQQEVEVFKVLLRHLEEKQRGSDESGSLHTLVAW